MKTRTSILFVSHSASRNGASLVLLHLIKWLRERTDYRLEVTYQERAYRVDDPYRWLPTLGEVDLHLIGEGRHENLWVAFFELGGKLQYHLAKGLRVWMEAVAFEEHRLVIARQHGLDEIRACTRQAVSDQIAGGAVPPAGKVRRMHDRRPRRSCHRTSR